jgi:hypothetical protein
LVFASDLLPSEEIAAEFGASAVLGGPLPDFVVGCTAHVLEFIDQNGNVGGVGVIESGPG